MNQILSVEMPKKKSKVKTSSQNDKASIKYVVTFFCIVLLILGFSLIGVSLYSILGNNKQQMIIEQTDLPRIDVTQNATELEIDISCMSEISSIEYNWEGRDKEQIEGNRKNNMELKIDIPSGTNIFTIKVTDTQGRTNEYSKEYVGAKEPNITVFDPNQKENTIIITCQESQLIKYMTYSYDENDEKQVEINNTIGTLEINALQGEHNLTIKVGYEDGTVGKLSKKIYAPTINVDTNGTNYQYNKFIINASDSRTIEKVKINFNGVETEEQVNQTTYSKEIDLQPGAPGTNRLIVTVYNKDGMVITKKVHDINRQN